MGTDEDLCKRLVGRALRDLIAQNVPCAMLCCAVLCYATPGYAMLRHVVL